MAHKSFSLPSYSRGRMLQWFIFSAILYALVLWGGKYGLDKEGWPLVIQSALTKGANINGGAFLGYWIDRTLYIGYDLGVRDNPSAFSDMAKALRLLSRALLVAACILGASMGTTA